MTKETILMIIGKVDSEVLINLRESETREGTSGWFFVDYTNHEINVGQKFTVIDGNTGHSIRLTKVYDQLGHSLSYIPEGFQTICEFEFHGRIPSSLDKLPVLKSWDYNPNAISIGVITEDHQKKNKLVEIGERLRIKANPGRIGYFTGRVMERGGRKLLQITFPDATQYFPENELEVISKGKQHPLDLLADGRIGRAADLRRLLTHVKLSGRLANLLYSMEVTNTDFYAYQFKPVLKMLNSVGNGILIADEVGLGKTIEAGLIWTELKSRFDYRRLMILCPAFLREKWQRELKKRFGIEAEILDAKGVHDRLKSASLEGPLSGFAIIGSMQGLRPQKSWDSEDSRGHRPSSLLTRFLSTQQHGTPLIDMLIIDEAHYLRIPDIKKTDKKTTILGRLLRDVSEQVVLLSATPIHLRSYDLYQLLNIVDDATFNQPAVFDEILSANAPLLQAREAIIRKAISAEEFKSLIEYALEHPLLQGNRQLNSMLVDLPSDEKLRDVRYRSELAYKLDSINLLGHVITRTRKRDVTEWRVIRDVVPEMVPLTENEQEFYEHVTETVREFCAKHKHHERFILSTPQRQMSSSMPAALREWKRRAELHTEQAYEDYGVNLYTDEIERSCYKRTNFHSEGFWRSGYVMARGF